MTGSRFAALTTALTLTACSGDATDGLVVEPPPQPQSCAENELTVADGTCRAIGVPAEACAEGFEPDGAFGCAPILPPEPCPAGLMAVPGETECRQVSPCGEGTWGGIPVETNTQFVDGSYGGADSDGTAERPWTTIVEAVAAADAGAIVAVAEGSYEEFVEIREAPVRLWGRCPALVEIVGPVQAPAVAVAMAAASGSEVRSLALRGGGNGLIATGTQDVALASLWIHDTAFPGIDVQDPLGPASVEIQNTLVEHTAYNGIYVYGCTARISASVVRDTLPGDNDNAGDGIAIYAAAETTRKSYGVIEQVLVERAYSTGIQGIGAEVTIRGTVVRDSQARVSDGRYGWGVNIQGWEPVGRTTLALRSSVIDNSQEIGVNVADADAVVQTSVVRGTRSTTSSLTAVSRGINVQSIDLWSVAVVSSSLIEGHEGLGVLASDSHLGLYHSVVRDTQPDRDGGTGRSVQVQSDPSAAESQLTITATLVDGSYVGGVLAFDAQGTIADTVVRATAPGQGAGSFGDGIVLAGPLNRSDLTVRNAIAEEHARCGIANFGAQLALAGSKLQCNPIHLDAEALGPGQPVFDDGGGNTCGCEGELEPCQVLSSSLEPPEPL